MKYFEDVETHPAPFTLANSTEPASKRMRVDKNQVVELDLVECSLNLLTMAPSYFKQLWNWTSFIEQFMGHANPEIRWIVCQCLSMISGMGEYSKIQLMAQQQLSNQEIRKYTLKYYRKINFSTASHHHLNEKVSFS